MVAVFWAETYHRHKLLHIYGRTELVGVEITALIGLCQENYNDLQLLRNLLFNYFPFNCITTNLKNRIVPLASCCYLTMLLSRDNFSHKRQTTSLMYGFNYYGERKWWIWGRTSQDFPCTTESFFNESCSLDPRESPGSARLSIWMLFCTDVLTCSPLCLQVKITHVAYCYSFYPPQLNWNGRCRRINLCARRRPHDLPLSRRYWLRATHESRKARLPK